MREYDQEYCYHILKLNVVTERPKTKMMMQVLRNYWWAAITPAFALVGYYLDTRQTVRYSGWKNKTELYQRELKQGEDPWTSTVKS